MIEIRADGCLVKVVGYQHENNRAQVRFPLDDVRDMVYGSPGGTFALAYKRAFDDQFYTSTDFEINDDYLIWTVGSHALAVRGDVEVQISYSTADAIAETQIFRFKVSKSIMDGTEGQGENLEDLIEQALTAAGGISAEIAAAEATLDAAVADAQAAQTAAETAQGAAETAQQEAETAKAGAEAAQEAAEGAQERAEAAEGNAAADAADAAQSASEGANSASAAALSASGAATSAAGAEADRIAAQGAKIAAEAAQAGAEAAQAAAETAVAGVETAGATQVAAVNAAGATQTGNVNTAGTTQVAAVNAAGAAVIESIPADYSELSADVSQVKNAFQSYKGGTIGQILRKKSNADNDVEWSDVGAPTDEQVESAVEGWLDEHPEATTTVEDGSLTEVKFSDSLKLQTLKDYVTPEMFGAKGDLATDDTQAIKDMIASGHHLFLFGNKTYKVTESIDFTIPHSTIVFNNTTIRAGRKSNTGAMSYVVGFKNHDIQTIGTCIVRVLDNALIGVWLAGVGGGHFDSFIIDGATIWGLYMDKSSNSNNSLMINYMDIIGCGCSLPAKGKYVSSHELELTEIDYSKKPNVVTFGLQETLFDSDYGQIAYLVDDSDYTYTSRGPATNRRVFYSRLSNPITLDENDNTTGIFDSTDGTTIPSNYKDDDAGRKIWILVGGAARFGSQAAEGVMHINGYSASSSAIGLEIDFAYAGTIDNIMLDSCAVGIVTRETIWSMYINYWYSESIGLPFTNTTTYAKSILLIAPNNNTRVIVGSSQVPIPREQTIIANSQGAATKNFIMPVISSNISKLLEHNFDIDANDWLDLTVDEYLSREVTVNTPSLPSGSLTKNITLDLRNTRVNTYNGFAPFHMYVKNASTTASTQKFKITLTSSLIEKGYSINKATNNVFTIDGALFNNNYVITIVLYGKVFYVSVEAFGDVLIEKVSGSTPTIVGESNHRYICGEVSSIDITPPSLGAIDVVFESGSTATVMSVPNTVKWANGFNSASIEANKTYEINILDGIYGVACEWT